MKFNFTIDENNYFFDSESLMLFQDFISDDKESDRPIVKNEFNKLFKATLIISNDCNGKCVYCYEKGGNFGRSKALMSIEDADRVIDYILKHFQSIGKVNFFGGEATLNMDLIKYIVNRLYGIIHIDEFAIVTNGTLIDDNMITFFDNYQFHITISLDGPDYIHDKLRLNCSYNSVMKTIKKIRTTSIGDFLELNCTYTKYHQEHITYTKLEEFFENLGIKYYISEVSTDIDWLKLNSNNEDFINTEKNNIDETYEKLYKNSLNKNLSPYACTLIDVLIDPVYYDKFCYELDDTYYTFHDYNGNKVPCARFITENVNNDYICKINSKKSESCLNCWARGLCTDCTADYIYKIKREPYLNGICYKVNLYEYALKKLVSIYKNTPEKFQTIVDIYMTNL